MMCVSVVIPCFNEYSYISDFLDKVLDQERTSFNLEIVVADGMSTDGTRDVLESYSKMNNAILIVDNTERIVSTGLNLAVQVSKGDIIVRMDVHTEYARDYIDNCVRTLISSGCDCVGGPWNIAVPYSLPGRAIALAFKSRVGSGGALSRNLEYEGEVDSVYLGTWWRARLVEVGLFDTLLVRNQDDELCLRIKRLGGRIYQSPAIRSIYHGRSSLVKLYKQFYQYGFWKPFVIRKHSGFGSVRHIAPFLAVTLGLVLLLLAFVNVAFFLMLSTVFLLYAVFIFTFLFQENKHETHNILFMTTLAIFIMHCAYGFGFLMGLIRIFTNADISGSGFRRISR